MVFINFIYDVLYAFDYAFSLVAEISRMSYLDVSQLIFNPSNDGLFEFTTLITSMSTSFTFPKVPIISDVLTGIFNILFGWTPFVFGYEVPFIVNVILGVIGNVFFITIIHWAIKLFGMLT